MSLRQLNRGEFRMTPRADLLSSVLVHARLLSVQRGIRARQSTRLRLLSDTVKAAQTPEAFARYIQSEFMKWRNLAKQMDMNPK